MGFFKRRDRPAEGDRFRIFYASDVHGSELAWRKFLSAGRVYNASALVMGGDLTGKAVVPVVAQRDGAVAEFQGRVRTLTGAEEIEAFEDSVRMNGFYPYRCDAAELERMRADPGHVTAVFERLMRESITRWVEIAEQRLGGTGVELFVMPGNDDELFVDELIAGDHIENCDGRRLAVGEYEMYSVGWATTTPWDTPRETTEEGMWDKILAVVGDATDFERAIFNFHEPPFDSGLDWGPALTEDLHLISEAGQAKQVPIGSHSVRRAIEEFQPLLALHGHVHESRAITTIGRTVCINPGSRYAEGVVDGAIVTLQGATVASQQLVTG
jgi:Icc-related predicted phosphoesterase